MSKNESSYRVDLHILDHAETIYNSIDEYVNYLHQNPKEGTILYNDFLIGVTKFFRDYEAFEIIREKIIPEIFASKEIGEPIRVWSVGCFTGEEPDRKSVV